MEIKKLEIMYKNQPLTLEYFIQKGKGKTILYLHGGACSKEDFLGSFKNDELKKYSLIAYDYPGCGNSPYPNKTEFTIDNLVEITRIFVLKLNLKNLHLIGHSTGGLVALLYILKYGEVQSFVSIEGNIHSDSCQFSREVIKQSREKFVKNGIEPLLSFLQSSENKGFLNWAKTIESSSSLKAFYDICPTLVQYFDNEELMQKYCKIKIPKIYIYGSENKNRFSFLKYFEDNQCCKIQEISNSNHFPFYDNPREFYEVLSGFFNINVPI